MGAISKRAETGIISRTALSALLAAPPAAACGARPVRVERMGGQLDTGFLISRFFDDRFALSDQGPLPYYLDTLLPHALLSPRSVHLLL